MGDQLVHLVEACRWLGTTLYWALRRRTNHPEPMDIAKHGSLSLSPDSGRPLLLVRLAQAKWIFRDKQSMSRSRMYYSDSEGAYIPLQDDFVARCVLC